MKCTYAIKYMDEINFTKSKCKITEKMEKIFQKVANEIKINEIFSFTAY